MSNNKVIHIINNANAGGAEKLLLSLIDEWKKEGWQSEIILLHSTGEYLSDMQHKAKVNAFNLDFKNPFGFVKQLISIRSLIKNTDVNHVQGWLYISNLITWLLTLGLHKKVSLGFHSADFKPGDFLISSRLSFYVLKLVSKSFKQINFVYCSKACRDSHINYGYCRSNSIIIENGIAIDQPPADLQLLQDNNVTSFLCIARFNNQKNIPLLLEAFSRALLIKKDISLTLAGKDMDENNQQLLNLIKKNKLSEEIGFTLFLIGFDSEITNKINKYQCTILPSSFGEALPLVVLESLSKGIPVITSDLESLKDIKAVLNLNDVLFKLFKNNSVTSLEQCLTNFNSNFISKEDRIRAFEAIYNNYSVSACAHKYIQAWGSDG